MAIKSLNEIVQHVINNMHDTMHDVDTKPGTFLRDVVVNPISDEFAAIYADMQLLNLKQSVLTATKTDLDKLAGNYFITRKPATNSYGKLRFYINNTSNTILPDEILIPKGTIVSTISSITKQPIRVQTSDSFYANRDRIKKLPVDSNYPLFYFIEIAAISIEQGSHTNVGTGELVQQINNINPSIAFVRNPFAFSGGTNSEDDSSLALRINLAMSGSNIGTKNGYLSYILKQNGVLDAKVIGAGDSIMFRDGGYIDAEGKYHMGKGGMVDIYIRGELKDEVEYTFDVTSDYINAANSNSYGDIILPQQPVANISRLEIIKTDVTDLNNFILLENAADYEIEKRNADEGAKYYRDILWDFSITDKFQDDIINYYLTNLDQTSLPNKLEIDTELTLWITSMENINYGLNWSLMTKGANSSNNFQPYYYNDNKIYKLVSSKLNNLTCVKKNDKIYARIYGDPDYALIKDESTVGNSIQAQDRIVWLKKNVWKNSNSPISSGNKLLIVYNINELIKDLQIGIEQKRVLTADVLVKQASLLPIEVILTGYCLSTEKPEKVKNAIINRITSYIDSLKKLGGEFDLSDIISIARQTEGVSEIDLTETKKPQIRVVDSESELKITAHDNEYFKVTNIIVDVFKKE